MTPTQFSPAVRARIAERVSEAASLAETLRHGPVQAADRRARRQLAEQRRTHVIVGDHDPEPRAVPYRSAITGLMVFDDENGYTHEWRG